MGPAGALLNNNDPAFSRDPLLPDKFRNWGPSYTSTPFYFTINAVYEIPGLGREAALQADGLGYRSLGPFRTVPVAQRPDGRDTYPHFRQYQLYLLQRRQLLSAVELDWHANEGYRAVVTGNYNLSSIGQSLSINPAASTTATSSGSPSTPSYPLNGNPGNQIINTAAFTIPFPCSQYPAADPHYGVGENLSCLGNAGSGQLLNIPGTRVSNLDMTVTKNFPLKHEGRNLQFRAEMYNLPNHTQFSGYNITPSYDWRNWLAGRLVQTNASLNRMTGTLNPRQMEMSLRLVF